MTQELSNGAVCLLPMNHKICQQGRKVRSRARLGWIAAALIAVLALFSVSISAQAAITYRSKSHDIAEGTSVSPAMPAGTVEGDLMIATVTHDSGASTITPPSGWILIQPLSRGSEQSHTRSYYRVAQSGESGPYTFTADLTNSMIAQIVTFYESTGVDVNGWTIEDSSYKYQTGSASITSNSVTGVANCLLYLAATDDDNQSVTTPPAGMTLVYEDQGGGNAMANYYEFRGAGAVTKSITWATVDELHAIAAIFSWTASAPTTRTVAIYPSGATPPSGYDATYTSMSAMEAAEDGDLVALNRFLRVEIVNSDGNWSTADTTAVTFDGWNCNRSAGQYVEIEVMSGARNPYTDGKWSASHYRLSGSGIALIIDNDAAANNYFEADFIGLQVETSGANVAAVVRDLAYHKTIRFIACHFRNTNATGTEVIQLMDNSLAEVWFINSILERTTNHPAYSILRATSAWTATAHFYNCTVVGGGLRGLDVDQGTITVKNCAVFNNGSTDILVLGGATVDYNASDDSVGTNYVDISPGTPESTEWNKAVMDYANGDYRLKDTNSVLYHAGLDQNSDSNVPSVDIAGNARPTGSNPVSIGAFEVAGGGDTDPPTPNPMTFASAPANDSATQISMTATAGTDATTPVNYLFTNDNSSCGANAGTGGTSSSWQSSTSYSDAGLQANKCYGYTVTARDSVTPTPNTGTASSISSTYTSANTPGTPTLSGATQTTLNLTNAENGNPSSNPTTSFAVQVVTTSPNDATWLNKWVDGSGNPSSSEVWQTDAQMDALVLQGLTSSTTYGVKVKARNQDGDETTLSAEGQGTTLSSPANLDQIHYRWRNDDGGESGSLGYRHRRRWLGDDFNIAKYQYGCPGFQSFDKCGRNSNHGYGQSDRHLHYRGRYDRFCGWR